MKYQRGKGAFRQVFRRHLTCCKMLLKDYLSRTVKISCILHKNRYLIRYYNRYVHSIRTRFFLQHFVTQKRSRTFFVTNLVDTEVETKVVASANKNNQITYTKSNSARQSVTQQAFLTGTVNIHSLLPTILVTIFSKFPTFQ